MTDYQRLVDEIRAFLQATDQTMTDRLKELADKYGEVCREVNQRLRRCEEYLKKGLRGEAIHFAQAEPVLLDVVAVLDFPERVLFYETLVFNAIPEPPQPLLEIAQDLNRAYAEEQPLAEDLLPRHRRLALLRAPVAERLQVLRKIAKVDASNPVWADDVRVFEAARLREIQAAMAGSARGDPERVAAFARELSEPGWLTPPPAALADQVTKQAALQARERARSELVPVVAQLDRAMDMGDFVQAQTLRDRYQQLAARASLAAGDPLARQADRPLKWLTQKEMIQQRELEEETALAALEDGLARQVDPERAAQLYEEALRRARALPARLEDRYRSYIKKTDSTRRWRERLVLLIVFFVGFILVGLVVWLLVKGRSPPSAAALSRPARALVVSSLTRIDPPRGTCHA
jgi:hypothetical protein